MNNKVKGTIFERKVCKILAENGYWVHFMTPDNRGAQPFDVIAVKNGLAIAIDCKTCDSNIFRMTRLEDNQIMAFERWMACGNLNPLIIIEHDEKLYCVKYIELKESGKVALNEHNRWQ